MRKFGLFITSMILGFGNLFIGFYAIGAIINHWELQVLLAPLLDFKTYWGLAYVAAIFTSGYTGIHIYKSINESDGNEYASIQSQFYTALAIGIGVAFSWMWTSIFF